ncbi:hypothetical protein KIW84_021102 [Lathyrus oleraceus]|uniref:Auxin response factor n=2 Tax=Pisum sativum TaxID=3888 RepID=A0A9D5B8U0_PEA|nr:hypothetical protein KIW84_021102 [Pisum sativum]
MVQQQLDRVDPKIWQECAGDSVPLLKLNSKLYYFPRGHLEHACPNYPATQALSLIDRCRPFTLCVISDVDLYADSETDELVAKLLLTPVTDGSVVPSEAGGEVDGDQILSCAKTLTQSDANNGGALSVPIKCATKIFPPLDYNTESPSQDVSVTDFHGVVWNFRHVFSGTPKRHLITHGWSTFADHKKLVSGDIVVFVKNLAGKITLGLRRKNRFAAAANITEKVVMVTKAAELADKNTMFEVMYYPTSGGFDFVMGTKVVEDALKIDWSPGMSVKYTVKTNGDTSKGCSVFHGTISTLSPPSFRPWRMLQVDWNESPVLNDLAKVSPWQVELIINIPTRHLPSKKIRAPQNSALLSDIEGDNSVPMRDSNNSSTSLLNQTVLNCETLHDDMQGVKHKLSKSTYFNFFKDDPMEELDNVSTEQNISSSISDDSHLQASSSKKTRAPQNSALLKDDTFTDGMQGARCSLLDKPAYFDFLKVDSMKELDNVPTEQNINRHVSLHDLSSNRSDSNSLDTKMGSTKNKEATSSSIILFGQTVAVKKNHLHDFNLNREENGKSINENEDSEKPAPK